MILKDLDRGDEAIAAYRRALEIRPDYAEAHNSLGLVYKSRGRIDDAIACFRRALSYQARFGAAYQNLVTVLLESKRDEETGPVFEAWSRHFPEDPFVRHMVAAARPESVPERASDAFIETLYARFAPHFEENLENLDYQAPRLLGAALASHLPPPDQSLQVLDAGCGTGLCAAHLRPYARRLVGVDLSKEMLERAADKDIYDDLVHHELTRFLGEHPAAFDLIVGGDVLIYFGRLAAVLTAAGAALRTGGRLAFTLERTEEAKGGYALRRNGRYQHSEGYLRQSLEDAGFPLVKLETAELRLEAQEPVLGYVVFARRSTGHANF